MSAFQIIILLGIIGFLIFSAIVAAILIWKFGKKLGKTAVKIALEALLFIIVALIMLGFLIVIGTLQVR